jgi:hypothetical protein
MNTQITSPYFWRRLAARLFIGLLLMSFLIQPGAQATAQLDPTCFILPDWASHNVTGTINSYWPGTTSAVAGDNHLHLGTRYGAAVDIAIGDLLLVVQMQGAQIDYTNTGTYGSGSGSNGSGYTSTGLVVGYYEYVVATSTLSGGSVSIISTGTSAGLVNGYTNAAATSTQGRQTFQVVRVPAYLNAVVTGNLTALTWDSTNGVGGIIALEVVNQISMTAARTISVNGNGFIGGVGRLNSGSGGANTDYRTRAGVNYNASKGEGIAGTPTGYPDGTNSDASYARGAPGNAGGGGNDNDITTATIPTGGGGGGNGGAGGVGGYPNSGAANGGRGGAAFTERGAERLVMGGGGGAGVTTTSPYTNSNGAAGGGMIFLRIGSKTGASILTLNANGYTATNNTASTIASGGGGAGGSVLLISNALIDTTVIINASGGAGGDSSTSSGRGGGGGGGVALYSDVPGTVTVAGGAAGGTRAGDGTAGYSSTTASLGAGAPPGFLCFQPTAVQLVQFSATPGFNPNWLLAAGLGILFVAVVGAWFYRKARSPR